MNLIYITGVTSLSQITPRSEKSLYPEGDTKLAATNLEAMSANTADTVKPAASTCASTRKLSVSLNEGSAVSFGNKSFSIGYDIRRRRTSEIQSDK